MGRRSNGEGTLFKRKDGRWSAQAYVTLPNGTTKRICITSRDHNTVKDAQLILGHANISTTLSVYQHGTAETQRAAISAIEERLFRT